MFAVTGFTGQVGGVVGRVLVADGCPVRAVVRSEEKAQALAERGYETALAEMHDAAALERAFAGTEGVFVLLPPVFDPSEDFAESRRMVNALRAALVAAAPRRVVCLSTIGAQVRQPNLLRQLSYLEEQLGQLPMPVTFLRAGWFMENTMWDIEPAQVTGVLESYLQPLDKPVPMVATVDVGRTAAALLQETWHGHRVVELEGPQRVTPLEIAATLSSLLGRPVQARAVPRAEWEARFRAQGMRNPTPRAQMIDGFNEAWIRFEGPDDAVRKGEISLRAVLATLVARAG